MLKTFFTYEQQLNKLQQEKGLIIPDITSARNLIMLQNVNYTSLLAYLHVAGMYAPMANISFHLKLMKQSQTLSYMKNSIIITCMVNKIYLQLSLLYNI